MLGDGRSFHFSEGSFLVPGLLPSWLSYSRTADSASRELGSIIYEEAVNVFFCELAGHVWGIAVLLYFIFLVPRVNTRYGKVHNSGSRVLIGSCISRWLFAPMMCHLATSRVGLSQLAVRAQLNKSIYKINELLHGLYAKRCIYIYDMSDSDSGFLLWRFLLYDTGVTLFSVLYLWFMEVQGRCCLL